MPLTRLTETWRSFVGMARTALPFRLVEVRPTWGLTGRSYDDLIVPNHVIVFDHHVLDLWRHDGYFGFNSCELAYCLDGRPLGDDQELDSLVSSPAQDGCTQEAGSLSDSRKGLAPQMLNVGSGTFRLRQATP